MESFASKIKAFFHLNSKNFNVRQTISNLIQDENIPSSEGNLDRHERALIKNVLGQKERIADDVMVPRADICALPDTLSLSEALAIIGEEHHSRMPVYHNDLDNIVGMVHVKDFIQYVNSEKKFKIKDILRQPLFISPTIPVLDLLLLMRQKQTHMALVIEEYGGIDGLVTIEDLLETIVGDIADEHDEKAPPMWIESAENQIDLDARLPILYLESRLGEILTNEEREAEIETVGGLVFRLAEHVPHKNEIIIHPSGLKFQVLNADTHHIRNLRMFVPTEWENRQIISEESGLDLEHESLSSLISTKD
ncbi:HlyC/CorC family transporter [Acetobacteraceae bacterium]|nr:HlyC/CorC family transporter [Acetobacteraceae bacterium]